LVTFLQRIKDTFFFVIPDMAWLPATGAWTILLLFYAFIASIIPVIILLQPRDYINFHQLLLAMGLLIVSVVILLAISVVVEGVINIRSILVNNQHRLDTE